MHIKPFKAKYPNFDLIPSPDLFFSTVNFDYAEFENSGFYKNADKEHIYIYRISKTNQSQLGVYAALDIEDYRKGAVLKHEHTIESKTQETIQKTLRRSAMIKPILLGYPNRKRIKNILVKYIESHPPMIDTRIKKSGEKHQIWKVEKTQSAKKIMDAFGQIDHVYIADGHHRSATMDILNRQGYSELNTDHIYCAMFPFEDLDIHAYNRVVDYNPTIKKTHIIARLSAHFEIDILDKYKIWPQAQHEIILLMNYEYYRLRWKKELLKIEKPHTLDTYLFNKYVISGIFDIADVRSDPRISYIRGTKGPQGVMEQVQKAEYRMGFVLYPLSKSDFVRTAYHGNVLPPKSTWFEPRMRNGMLVMDLSGCPS